MSKDSELHSANSDMTGDQAKNPRPSGAAPAATGVSTPEQPKGGGIKHLLVLANEHVHKLHLALQEEHHALSNNNLNAFERSVQNKIRHTSELEAIEKSIFTLLRNSGFKMDKNGIADYINTLGTGGSKSASRKAIESLWEKLSHSVLKCQEQNQINGRILNLASINIRQALEVLTGQRGVTKTYSASGKQSKDDNSNSIAVA